MGSYQCNMAVGGTVAWHFVLGGTLKLYNIYSVQHEGVTSIECVVEH